MNGEQYLRQQLQKALAAKGFAADGEMEIALERPKAAEHGDLATNLALLLAKTLKRKPRDIADDILQNLELDAAVVSGVEVAGAGFINFRFTESYFRNALRDVLQQGKDFGRASWGNQKKVQIEFVSANPTGPLNVVSARAATVGDVLANLFDAVGFATQREYYVNDAGRQVRLLGMSVSSRYLELLGKSEPFPEEGYHGEYIRDLAKEILSEEGETPAAWDAETRWAKFSKIALEKIVASQQQTLARFGVRFDNWYRESLLRAEGAHLNVLRLLEEKGYLYEKDGARWFKSSQFGDEKDRVLVTSDGEPTYFLVDIAYHVTKYQRGFEMIYDLWGPDHHGYIERMKAALQALGYPRGSFAVIIIQQVNLIEGGEVVKMSKRAGKIIEMAELIEEVGVDVARFFFAERRTQSPLDFDLDLAKNTSEENPVYYVQYAHARICNILKFAREQGQPFSPQADLNLLQEAEEMTLIKKLLEYPEAISKAARFLEPHRVPAYLQELAATFHRFYHHHQVVSNDRELTKARLLLVEATRIVLANGLSILGISAPERM
jgi:arginyl-tRNA synthetase